RAVLTQITPRLTTPNRTGGPVHSSTGHAVSSPAPRPHGGYHSRRPSGPLGAIRRAASEAADLVGLRYSAGRPTLRRRSPIPHQCYRRALQLANWTDMR